mmetsp:Transcript_30516/g.102915  ORF Transcript_30516/g.102915 Transcript_30516/m.102915 type:complete len:262 (+) Transcript_30516:284-1069(+)
MRSPCASCAVGASARPRQTRSEPSTSPATTVPLRAENEVTSWRRHGSASRSDGPDSSAAVRSSDAGKRSEMTSHPMDAIRAPPSPPSMTATWRTQPELSRTWQSWLRLSASRSATPGDMSPKTSLAPPSTSASDSTALLRRASAATAPVSQDRRCTTPAPAQKKDPPGAAGSATARTGFPGKASTRHFSATWTSAKKEMACAAWLGSPPTWFATPLASMPRSGRGRQCTTDHGSMQSASVPSPTLCQPRSCGSEGVGTAAP